MILIDTNVMSELMRAEPAPAVVTWIDGHRRSMLFTSVVVQAEILYGWPVFPKASPRRAAGQATAIFEEDFAGRILPVTEAVAEHYAQFAAARRHISRPFGLLDPLIAATARNAEAEVAMHNTAHFDDCGIGLINPWELA